MDWFGPFEFLALLIFLGSSFVSIALIGRSPFNHNRREWYRSLWYPDERSKPTPITLMALLVICAIDLGLTGWGAWVTPIEYENVSEDSEAQELVSVWNSTRVFWKFVVIMSLHLAALFIIPLWCRTFFGWRKLKWALFLIGFEFMLAVLLTVFGYLFYWGIGLGYTFFLTIVIYLLIHNAILVSGSFESFPFSKTRIDENDEEFLSDAVVVN